jgi:hypothetical protein
MNIKDVLKDKRFYIKTLYVLVWSMALMYASFSDFFTEKGFDWSFQSKLTNDAKPHYIFPYILAMALFLIDAIYAFALEAFRGKQEGIILVLMGVVIFLFCFLMSLSGGESFFFLIGWAALTLVKWIKTEPSDYSSVIPTVVAVAEA